MSKPEKVEGIVLISGPARDSLNDRQLIAYKGHRKKYIRWLARKGKDPEKLEGYAHDTAKNHANILDKFHRWAWVHGGGYTLDVSHDDAEDYLQELLFDEEKEYSNSHLHNVKLALKAFFRFKDDGEDWDCEITVKSTSSAAKPKDYLTDDERSAFREAALEFGTVPSYKGLDPEGREKWKMYLARRFGKPMNEVSPGDWDRANGFKYPSIVHAALDAGLRPIEVGRAKTYWVDVDNAALRIPMEDSAKGDENWTTSIREETAQYLAHWLEEREMYDKYDGTDQLWLTRHGNPYNSSSLRYLMDNLCEIAGIERDISWYAIRHSTGTYMAREEDLAAAQSQLRHKRTKTTMKYDQAPLKDRRDALDRMG